MYAYVTKNENRMDQDWDISEILISMRLVDSFICQATLSVCCAVWPSKPVRCGTNVSGTGAQYSRRRPAAGQQLTRSTKKPRSVTSGAAATQITLPPSPYQLCLLQLCKAALLLTVWLKQRKIQISLDCQHLCDFVLVLDYLTFCQMVSSRLSTMAYKFLLSCLPLNLQ